MYINTESRRIYTASDCKTFCRPEFWFGDRPELTLQFPAGTVSAGDEIFVAMDNDFRFADSNGEPLPPMIHDRHFVTQAEEDAQIVTMTVTTRRPKFLHVVNHKDYRAQRELCRFRVVKLVDTGVVGAALTMVVLGVCDNAIAHSTPSDYDIADIELDIEHYYTRAEINAIVAAMDEKVDTAETASAQAQYSAGIATEKANEAREAAERLPQPSIADTGKVPTVTPQGEYALETPQGGMPTISTGDAGKVPVVKSDESGYELGEVDVSGAISQHNADENAHSAVLEGYVRKLSGATPPTISLMGDVGDLYTDTATGKLYMCQGMSGDDYVWNEVVEVDSNGKVASSQIPVGIDAVGGAKFSSNSNNGLYGLYISTNDNYVRPTPCSNNNINWRADSRLLRCIHLDYGVRSVSPLITYIPANSNDVQLYDASSRINNHSTEYVHEPSSAPTYRLPDVSCIIADGKEWKRNASRDTATACFWDNYLGSDSRCTDSANPSVGDFSYNSPTLINGKQAITSRNSLVTHTITLTVTFTSCVSYSFQDADGNPVPTDTTPNISYGSVVCFLCSYCVDHWVIMPLVMEEGGTNE